MLLVTTILLHSISSVALPQVFESGYLLGDVGTSWSHLCVQEVQGLGIKVGSRQSLEQTFAVYFTMVSGLHGHIWMPK